MSNFIGTTLSSSPNSIIVEIERLDIFENQKTNLQIGKYLKIANGNHDFVICVINNIKVLKYDVESDIKINIECQPIGHLEEDRFQRGGHSIPVPTEPVFVLEDGELDLIFSTSGDYDFPLGTHSQSEDIEVRIDGDNFFSKHVAVVGSTGSGKSCTVAKILQTAVGIDEGRNLHLSRQRNSHLIIFDIHAEYASAFTLLETQNFSLNKLSIDNLVLPYWLMNAEELESLFIESNESNSHNQVSIFKQSVILNKERHNPDLNDVTYDTPVYFSINEVYNYIENMNREVIGRLSGENYPKLLDGTLVENRSEFYFETVLEFIPQSSARDTKATNGPFYGEFNRFVSRLETKLSDKRLKFLLDRKKENGSTYNSEDFEGIMKQFLGYINKENISIVDLSGIPFEVLSITVSLISRLIFDFCFHYSKFQHEKGLLNDVPVMIVCEEAHNYIPRSDLSEYKSSKKSLERIAKEGRKYGLSLMVVSQRPSEVSETIFAQCNNFIALRLTNNKDQNYIKSLLPDSTATIGDILPNLVPGECIVVGDAIIMPSIVKVKKPNPEPKSQSIKFHKEWNMDWKEIEFTDIIQRWKKEILEV